MILLARISLPPFHDILLHRTRRSIHLICERDKRFRPRKKMRQFGAIELHLLRFLMHEQFPIPIRFSIRFDHIQTKNPEHKNMLRTIESWYHLGCSNHQLPISNNQRKKIINNHPSFLLLRAYPPSSTLR